MLGVVVADDFSVTQYVQQLVTSSAQTNYALRVLRCHGLSNTTLQLVYCATVVARLTYAASTWRGLTKTSDRQRINSVIDRARRLRYCSPDLTTFDEPCDIADDELLRKVLLWSNHVLHTLLPLYSPRHNATTSDTELSHPTVAEHSTHLSDCNFLTRMSYKNTY